MHSCGIKEKWADKRKHFTHTHTHTHNNNNNNNNNNKATNTYSSSSTPPHIESTVEPTAIPVSTVLYTTEDEEDPHCTHSLLTQGAQRTHWVVLYILQPQS